MLDYLEVFSAGPATSRAVCFFIWLDSVTPPNVPQNHVPSELLHPSSSSSHLSYRPDAASFSFILSARLLSLFFIFVFYFVEISVHPSLSTPAQIVCAGIAHLKTGFNGNRPSYGSLQSTAAHRLPGGVPGELARRVEVCPPGAGHPHQRAHQQRDTIALLR